MQNQGTKLAKEHSTPSSHMDFLTTTPPPLIGDWCSSSLAVQANLSIHPVVGRRVPPGLQPGFQKFSVHIIETHTRITTNSLWSTVCAYIHSDELISYGLEKFNEYLQHISAPLQQEPVDHTLFLSVIST